MESEDLSPRRFLVAGTVLVGGLLFGMILAGTFRWSPYYWQWLAYHNALVAAVIVYLLLPASEAESPGAARPSPAFANRPSSRSRKAKRAYLLDWE